MITLNKLIPGLTVSSGVNPKDPGVPQGFATYNNCPHLCVDVPNGEFTISCRTQEGKQITFAFLAYRPLGPAQCVDIQRHNTPLTVGDIGLSNKAGVIPAHDQRRELPLISTIHFGPSGYVSDIHVTPKQGYGKVCVLLEDRTYEGGGK